MVRRRKPQKTGDFYIYNKAQFHRRERIVPQNIALYNGFDLVIRKGSTQKGLAL